MPRPLAYTFGNHMHWVDMQWLWGYQVLPDSVRDMLHLCAETGAKGNVNFDGIGYEKLAAEDPEVLAELRAAIAAGTIEVVGAGYGQPYGLFQGGESNIRQRVYGVRTVQRLLGTRPRAFWEEEFDFFPQLPQILAGAGFRVASLFFQWTWHTPHLPVEEQPLVLWEGVDGTRLPALARTRLCLHQWPEDFDGLLESDAVQGTPRPLLLQWLELLPSPDWMCRSEVLLPRLKELFADPRFELSPGTLSEQVAALDLQEAPVRAYRLDAEVFHGVSLGKNGDRVPRASARCERALLAAEALSAVAGLCGRPYAGWDVYPSWELEESWRELLAAQHHDNHECEGLCGDIGHLSFERSHALARGVLERTRKHLAQRIDAPEGSEVVFNPLGWQRDLHTPTGVARRVPAFGWAIVEERRRPPRPLRNGDTWKLVAGETRIEVAEASGSIFLDGREIGAPTMLVDGETVRFDRVRVEEREGKVRVERRGPHGRIDITLEPAAGGDALRLTVEAELGTRPDGGVRGALALTFPLFDGKTTILADSPYSLREVTAEGSFQRKYPSGDWMTSEQWYETVEHPFTSLSLVDLVGGEGGLLITHDGSQAWQRRKQTVRCILNLYDPWDEERFVRESRATFELYRHADLPPIECYRRSVEARHPACPIPGSPGGDLPPRFTPLEVSGAGGVLVTAFYREHAKAAQGLEDYFAGELRNPFVLRLVEWNGKPTRVHLRPFGPLLRAARTNLLGEVIELLDEPILDLRPHEIATVMLDLKAGHHQPRHLDQHREVWARAHRTEA